MTDSEIVDLYLGRQETAISATAEKYGRRLRSLSRGIVGDDETAEECENDTYLETWNRIPPHEPRNYLYPFLARILRHVSLNRCRERKRLKRSAEIAALSEEMEECLPSPDDTESRLNEKMLTDALNGYLATLSEEKRNIFLRRYWFLDSVSTIAKRYGCSESKVKTVLSRCRDGLREYLTKGGFAV